MAGYILTKENYIESSFTAYLETNSGYYDVTEEKMIL